MNYSIERLHTYSYLFSSQTCARALRFGDIEDVRYVFRKYDEAKEWNPSCWEYLAKIYRVLKRNYRNEYVYKNELINSFIKHKYCSSDTVILNEFGTGRSIADIATFNGTSKAFEIKSERDSDKRLLNQLNDYQKLFEECYVVIPEELYTKYLEIIDEKVGMIALSHRENGAIELHSVRQAEKNETVDIDILMQSVRTPEYKWMVKQVFGKLPDVSCFEMFKTCRNMLSGLPNDLLHLLFKEAVKSRKRYISSLKDKDSDVRQLFLSMNLSSRKEAELMELYSQNL